MSGMPMRERQDRIKDLIRELHAGAGPEDVKERFKDVLEGTGSAEIMQVEEELIREGMPREEVRRLCDVHLAVFREALGEEGAPAPPGHPVHTLMEEHKRLLEFAGRLNEVARLIGGEGSAGPAEREKLNRLAEMFKSSAKHYLREENVLFPYLERHGIVEPPAIMWSEHDEIRAREKKLYELLDRAPGLEFSRFAGSLTELARSLADFLASHFYKENNILFPMALQVITPAEWPEIRRQCDGIGYFSYVPPTADAPVERKTAPPGEVALATGSLTREQLEAILNTLPVDLTFVDAEDTVRYFSQSPERIFPRTEAVIGRKVQQCHPEKSLREVEKVLDGLRNKAMDSASFWINLAGRLILIRYFPVRSADGQYLGCLEVSQDITGIKKIEGEKRLLR